MQILNHTVQKQLDTQSSHQVTQKTDCHLLNFIINPSFQIIFVTPLLNSWTLYNIFAHFNNGSKTLSRELFRLKSDTLQSWIIFS